MALYLRLVGASIRSRLQFKVDFVITTLLYAVITAVDFLTVAAILYRYREVSGWNIYEIALLAGVASAATGLFRTFAAELSGFERYLVTGEFDNLMTRPLPTLVTLLARNFDLGRLGATLQGLVLLSIGLKGVLAQGAPPWLAVYIFLLPVAGFFIMIAIALLVATAGFWLTRIDDLQTFALNAPMTAVNYPMEIYPRWLRWLLTGVLPVATMAYLPLTYALGKGGMLVMLLAPFLTATVAMLLTLRLWRWGERHYQSTGN